MRTFSELVDEVAKDVGRRASDQLASAVNYAIRDVEKTVDTPLIFIDEFCEMQGYGVPIMWNIPDVRRFLRLVYVEDADGTPAEGVRPSDALARRRKTGLPYYWQSGRCVTFANFRCGAKFTWACHSPWFEYYKPGERPEFDGTIEHANFDKVSSLTLCSYDHLIVERAKQKIKNNNNDPGASNQDRETQRVKNYDLANL